MPETARPLAHVRTLSELIAAHLTWIEGQIRIGKNEPDTLVYYRGELGRWAATLGADLQLESIVTFHLTGAGDVSAHRIQAVKRLFRWARKNGLTEGNPFADVQQPAFGQRERVIERDEAAELLQASDPRPRLRRPAGDLRFNGVCGVCEREGTLIPVLLRSAGIRAEFDREASICAGCRKAKMGLWKGKHRSTLANASRWKTNTAIRPLRWALLALGHTGARPGELRRLQWSHLDWEQCQFTLSKFKGKKRRSQRNAASARIILVDAVLMRVLRIWHARRQPGADDFVFLNWYGKPWTCNALASGVRRARDRAGLGGDEKFVAYHFRHAVGTRAARPLDDSMPGATLPEIGALLGHAPGSKSTQRYVHLPSGSKKTLAGALARPRKPKPD
jgi:integrase